MIKGVKALIEETKNGTNYEYWIIIGIMFLTIEKLYEITIFRKYHYSNTIKIMMFIFNLMFPLSYVKFLAVSIYSNQQEV